MPELSLKNSRINRRYDVLELLGRGSYAEIYLARDTVATPESPHSRVVIKALNVNLQNDLDPDLERTLVENFQNEAIALDRVRHPNVVSRLGHGTARDLRGAVFHFLVLEFLPGGDLAKRCRERALTVPEALGYLEQVCAGLAHAHRHGVIHRDIKPQNILLTEDGQTAKIADFGVARFSQSDSPITRVGTNIYAPPEHSPLLADEVAPNTSGALTPAADIYSLAKTAFVLLTGESPRFFAGRQIHELPHFVRGETWAPALLDILSRATRQDPAARHQTVEEFWHDLSRIKHLGTGQTVEIETQVSARRSDAPRAHVARGYTPFAPQLPRFNTSRELKLKGLQIPAAVAGEAKGVPPRPAGEAQRFPAMPPARSPVSVPASDYRPPDVEPAPPPKKNKFLKRLAITVVLLSLFAGILYGTHLALRGLGTFSISSLFSKREGATVRDVPLRAEANARSNQLGWVPTGSRVRILSETDTWFEVEILQFGRPREDDWQTRGWIAKKAKSGEDNVDFAR